MATARYIKQVADELTENSGTRDPRAIAEDLRLLVYERPDFEELLGMYAVLNDIGCIFINANLNERLTRLVFAHELGHDRLHHDLAKRLAIWDFQLYDIQGKQEYEANAFAAHLLLADEDVMDALRDGYSVSELASMTGYDEALILIKLNEMKKLGWNLPGVEIPSGNFLKQIKPTDYESYC